MKAIVYITSIAALVLTSNIYAHGGGGHGGGGHGGGARPHGGGHHGGHGGGSRQTHHRASHHNRGAHGHRNHGHWNRHSDHHGHGNWSHRNYNGYNYNSWSGPYYYSGFGWYAGGLFLIGLTFYTCAALQNIHTWQIDNSDVATYNSWKNSGDLDNLSITEIDDPNYKYLICNGNNCIKANPAPQ